MKFLHLIAALILVFAQISCKKTKNKPEPDVAETVYVGGDDKMLYAIDAVTGMKKWAFATGERIFPSPTVAGGVVYVGSSDKKLYAIDAVTGMKNGSLLPAMAFPRVLWCPMVWYMLEA